MSTVRLRRLEADFQRLQDYVKRHPRVQLVQAEGEPPEKYQLQFQVRSLRQKNDRLIEVDTHLVEIFLPLNYPRLPPQCRMLTPVFHPNIAPHAICIGDHWSAGQTLESIVMRIGELLAYQTYNTKSPLNGEAARWVSEHEDDLPLDAVSMLVEETGKRSAPKAPVAKAAVEKPVEKATAVIQFSCPHCDSQLRVPAAAAGKQIRCPRCKQVARAPAKGTVS